MNLNRKVFCYVLLCLATLTGCKEEAVVQQAKTTYKLLTLEKQSRELVANYSASIRGKQDIDIYPQVSGYLTTVAVNEGEEVKQGDVLFIIEQTPYKAALQGAKANVAISRANVATAELTYGNTIRLKNKNIVSESELIAKRNALNSAKAQLDLAISQQASAQANLNFTVIKSPSNGIVGKLPHRNGALVSPSLREPLTIVSDNSDMYVYFSMTENQILSLINQYGSLDSVVTNMPSVELQLNNGSIYEHNGNIASISGVIENNTGAVSIRASFPNVGKKLLSGGSGNIRIPEVRTNVIVIPKAATYELQDKTCVYRVVDGKAKSTIIEIAKNSNDQEYIVESGIEVGEVIIAEGAGLVRNGTVVNQ